MAIKALKYMLLSKVPSLAPYQLRGILTCTVLSQVMLNLPDEVTNLVSGKLALRYPGKHFVNNLGESKKNSYLYFYCRRHSGPDMESMKAVALAAKARSLADFQKAVKAYKVKYEQRPPLHLPSV